MRTNAKIKETFYDISKKSVKLSNKENEHRKYLRRLIRTFNKTLSEEEQIYVISILFEELSFKSTATDPARVNEIYNIKAKYMFQVAVGIGIVILAAGFVFRGNPYLESIITNVIKALKFFT